MNKINFNQCFNVNYINYNLMRGYKKYTIYFTLLNKVKYIKYSILYSNNKKHNLFLFELVFKHFNLIEKELLIIYYYRNIICNLFLLINLNVH